jgi:hypothetical protein
VGRRSTGVGESLLEGEPVLCVVGEVSVKSLTRCGEVS